MLHSRPFSRHPLRRALTTGGCALLVLVPGICAAAVPVLGAHGATLQASHGAGPEVFADGDGHGHAGHGGAVALRDAGVAHDEAELHTPVSASPTGPDPDDHPSGHCDAHGCCVLSGKVAARKQLDGAPQMFIPPAEASAGLGSGTGRGDFADGQAPQAPPGRLAEMLASIPLRR